MAPTSRLRVTSLSLSAYRNKSLNNTMGRLLLKKAGEFLKRRIHDGAGGECGGPERKN